MLLNDYGRAADRNDHILYRLTVRVNNRALKHRGFFQENVHLCSLVGLDDDRFIHLPANITVPICLGLM